MGQFTFLTNPSNKIATATLTVVSESSTYPKANLQVEPIAKTYRTTGKTAESVLMDLGSAQSINFLALINHNLSSGATITIKAGTTSGVSDLTPVTMTWREFDAYKILASTEIYRYWKIELADSGNTASYLEIGLIMIGLATQYSFGPAYDTPKVEHVQENVDNESEFGAPHVHDLYSRVKITFDFKVMSSANASTILTAFLALKRNLYPLFLILDSDSYEGYFGRFKNNLRRRLYIYTDLENNEFWSDGRGRSVAS